MDEILSRYCKNCALHIPLKETNPAVYEGKCHLNHEGSTSSMESAAAVAVFSRSFKNYGRIQNIMDMSIVYHFQWWKTFIKAQRL